MKKVKILEVLPSIQEGGIEHFLYNYLSNMDLSKFQIDLLTQYPRYNESEKKFKDLGLNIYAIYPKKVNIIKYFKELKEIFKNGKYDVVHVHLSAKSFWIQFVAKKYGVKVRIAHAHEARDYSGFKKIIYKIYGFLTKISCTQKVACGSLAAEKTFGKKISYVTIPNAIDCDAFRFNEDNREIIRKKLKLNKEDIVLFNVGRMSKEKNQFFLLDIMKKLSYDKKYKLIIAGDGPLHNELVKKTKELLLQKNIIYVGNINNVNEYYSAVDCFLLPSQREGFPVTAIEAECSGLPCIFSDKITNEVDIINSIFLPITDAGIWIDKLADISMVNRENGYKKIYGSKYNIKNGTLLLEQIYTKGI